MITAGSIGWRANGSLEIPLHQTSVKVTQQRPVVEERPQPATLGVSGNLAAFEHQIRIAFNCELREIDRRAYCTEDDEVTVTDVLQFGSSLERQRERVV